MKKCVLFSLFALSGLQLITSVALAVTIDGRLDPVYGPALSTQTTQTFAQDNPSAFGGADSMATSFGSELDAGYGFVSGGVLYLFLAGNLMSYFGELPHQDQLHLFIDCRSGGQNQLRGDNADVGFSPNSKLNTLAGLTFDSDFTPDYWLDCLVDFSSPPVHAYFAELRDGGGGSGYFLGRAAAGGPGSLSGGTNPDGIEMTIDDSNSGGVTTGCQAASSAYAGRGIEWAIPLAAIGNPSGPIKVCALIGGAFINPYLSNQVLGPVPPGTCGLGNPATVDFGTIAGSQYFTIDATTSVPAPAPGLLALSRPRPNPFSGETRFSLDLARGGPVFVSVSDLSGRRVATIFRGDLGPGRHDFAWNGESADGFAAPNGVYFLQANVGADRLARSAFLLRRN